MFTQKLLEQDLFVTFELLDMSVLNIDTEEAKNL